MFEKGLPMWLQSVCPSVEVEILPSVTRFTVPPVP